jgi:hypothetical protein
MEYKVNFLLSALGTQEKVAESLGYPARYYRKIRKKIAQGEKIPQRIAKLLQAKVREFCGTEHDCW